MSHTDPDAGLAKLKDGRTRLACNPEHVVDLETGAILAAAVRPADVADPASVETSLTEAEANLQTAQGNATATPGDAGPPQRGSRLRRKVVAGKGYHKGILLQRLKVQRYRTCIPERRQAGRAGPGGGDGRTWRSATYCRPPGRISPW
ncbi:MAG TPA: hypothetical protein PK384_00765 [Candidatus Latescibacteria bacterium]|nr:hypothetical protein [Candidatus Latescibacterota bacterium]